MNEASLAEQIELLEAIGKGDQAAFERLYRLTSPRLFAVALRMLRNHARAEEVLHDCFITVLSQAINYNPSLSSPLTWLTHIVRNRAIDLMRGNDNRLQGWDEDEADNLADDAPSPVSQLQQSSEAKRLEHCMAYLPAEQRQSIMLAYYQGLSHSEVSEHLQQPLGTVKSWIRRALEHLKSCVGI
ncbi:RNA polymerase sigma factor [Yersinia entomophaga]|uniref:RNA polymerase sigma factor n=1 Tax=Yersinia entomophaga TaxID=935293 RepID=A0ABM6BGT2_YERET|nr:MULTISPECIES: sigma-70 family RNA polymerase sigma factor [Yersinia]ANI28609.1 RNA polymerase sigma factor [Yersinia entomophaga]OWF89845.1 RNA polymerase subunit sigma [Yersinia entomophaga]